MKDHPTPPSPDAEKAARIVGHSLAWSMAWAVCAVVVVTTVVVCVKIVQVVL